jgi:hypothetical protein
VEDRKDLLERLADLYSDTGRAEEARALQAEIGRPEQSAPAGTSAPPERHLSAGPTSPFGGEVAPLLGFEKFVARRSGSGPRGRGAAGKVGRNDPCPCGSGKKFKRCCGRTTA